MASSPSGTAPNAALMSFSEREEWVDECDLVLHRIPSCLGLHRLYLHFFAQHHLRRLHLRITGTVILQRAW